MRTLLSLSALSLAAVLAACGPTSNQPPMSTSGAGAGSSMPQSPNSLPLGSSTMQPLTSPTGTVGQTSVGGTPAMAPGSTAYVDGAAPPPRRRVVRRRRPVRHPRPAVRAPAATATPAPMTSAPVTVPPTRTVPPGMPAPGAPAPSMTR